MLSDISSIARDGIILVDGNNYVWYYMVVLFIYLFIYLFVYLFIYLFIYVFIYLFICLFVCLFIDQSTITIWSFGLKEV